MDLKNYHEKSASTAIYGSLFMNEGEKHCTIKFAYPAFGFVSEILELTEKIANGNSDLEILAECGDVLWYIHALIRDFGMGIELFENKIIPCNDLSNFARDLQKCAENVSSKCKKTIRDHYGQLPENYMISVKDSLLQVYNLIAGFSVKNNSSIENVRQSNIDKLFSRKERGTLSGDGDNR